MHARLDTHQRVAGAVKVAGPSEDSLTRLTLAISRLGPGVLGPRLRGDDVAVVGARSLFMTLRPGPYAPGAVAASGGPYTARARSSKAWV